MQPPPKVTDVGLPKTEDTQDAPSESSGIPTSIKPSLTKILLFVCILGAVVLALGLGLGLGLKVSRINANILPR